MSRPVKVAKRASPPAFLAVMFQTAWIRPARMTSARDRAGMESNASGSCAFDCLPGLHAVLPVEPDRRPTARRAAALAQSEEDFHVRCSHAGHVADCHCLQSHEFLWIA